MAGSAGTDGSTSPEGGAGGQWVGVGGAGGGSAEGGSGAALGGAGGQCRATYQAPRALAVPPLGLKEASGLTLDPTAGRLFSVNDSGNPALVYELTLEGKLVQAWAPRDAEVSLVDWEDLALGPSQAGRTEVVVADIGDNQADRTQIVLYTLEVPESGSSGSLSLLQRLVLTYPDGARDAETLLVDTETREFVIVSKELPPLLYSGVLPLEGGDHEFELKAEGELPPGVGGNFVPSGGAVVPQGWGVAMRSRQRLLLFPRARGQSVLEALQEVPCELPLADEPQGEAVTFHADGSYYTVGEGGSPLYLGKREL